MKILTMYTKNHGGGCFKRLNRMIKACLDSRMEVHYIAPEPFKIKHQNIYFHRFKRLFRNDFLYYIFFILFVPFLVLKIVSKYKIKKIVVFGSFFSALSNLTKLFKNVKIINFVRVDEFAELSFKKVSRIFKILYIQLLKKGVNSSYAIYPNSEIVLEIMKKRFNLKNKKIGVLYNNLTIRNKIKKSLNSKNNFVVGTVTDFDLRKRDEWLIEAASKLSDIDFVLVGSGPNENKVKKMVKERKLQNVHFTGWKDNVFEILPSFDLFVICSKFEGSPNALLEALSCGIPCIGSDVVGTRETLESEELLFKDKSDLTNKISKYKHNTNKIRRICFEKRKKFLFDWNKKIVNLIDEK